MRATFARVALVLVVSTGLAGCKSMSGLAFWRSSKKDDTKLADAPKYPATSPATSDYVATGSSATPAYGTTASTASGVQAQAGLYNPAYDGGAANRYVSGAAIPPATASTTLAPSTPAGSYAQSYRTADA